MVKGTSKPAAGAPRLACTRTRSSAALESQVLPRRLPNNEIWIDIVRPKYNPLGKPQVAMQSMAKVSELLEQLASSRSSTGAKHMLSRTRSPPERTATPPSHLFQRAQCRKRGPLGSRSRKGVAGSRSSISTSPLAAPSKGKRGRPRKNGLKLSSTSVVVESVELLYTPTKDASHLNIPLNLIRTNCHALGFITFMHGHHRFVGCAPVNTSVLEKELLSPTSRYLQEILLVLLRKLCDGDGIFVTEDTVEQVLFAQFRVREGGDDVWPHTTPFFELSTPIRCRILCSLCRWVWQKYHKIIRKAKRRSKWVSTVTDVIGGTTYKIWHYEVELLAQRLYLETLAADDEQTDQGAGPDKIPLYLRSNSALDLVAESLTEWEQFYEKASARSSIFGRRLRAFITRAFADNENPNGGTQPDLHFQGCEVEQKRRAVQGQSCNRPRYSKADTHVTTCTLNAIPKISSSTLPDFDEPGRTKKATSDKSTQLQVRRRLAAAMVRLQQAVIAQLSANLEKRMAMQRDGSSRTHLAPSTTPRWMRLSNFLQYPAVPWDIANSIRQHKMGLHIQNLIWHPELYTQSTATTGEDESNPPPLGTVMPTTVKNACKHLVDALKRHPSHEPFFEPIPSSFKAYHRTIREPMCLKELYTNLLLDEYADFGAFKRHLELIWKNCLTFNETQSDLWQSVVEMGEVLVERGSGLGMIVGFMTEAEEFVALTAAVDKMSQAADSAIAELGDVRPPVRRPRVVDTSREPLPKRRRIPQRTGEPLLISNIYRRSSEGLTANNALLEQMPEEYSELGQDVSIRDLSDDASMRAPNSDTTDESVSYETQGFAAMEYHFSDLGITRDFDDGRTQDYYDMHSVQAPSNKSTPILPDWNAWWSATTQAEICHQDVGQGMPRGNTYMESIYGSPTAGYQPFQPRTNPSLPSIRSPSVETISGLPPPPPIIAALSVPSEFRAPIPPQQPARPLTSPSAHEVPDGLTFMAIDSPFVFPDPSVDFIYQQHVKDTEAGPPAGTRDTDFLEDTDSLEPIAPLAPSSSQESQYSNQSAHRTACMNEVVHHHGVHATPASEYCIGSSEMVVQMDKEGVGDGYGIRRDSESRRSVMDVSAIVTI
ncbi:hypothetical protein HDU85_001606 [Gaertneriomyces sp. JEL0708]|nr:hypothetical protein HDU85_001606 [Gaertneriomyces sp. JEL0708]